MEKKESERSALQITIVYMLASILWILFSESILHKLCTNLETIAWLSVIKGWLFVGLTGGILYKLIAHSYHSLKEKNTTLARLNEELLASEEELRQQLEELLQREEEIRRQNLVLNSLQDTALGLMNQRDLKELLNDIAGSAAKLIGTEHVHIIIANEAKGVFERKVGLGIFADHVWCDINLTEGLVGQVYRTGEVKTVDQYRLWENRRCDLVFDQVDATVQVPLRLQSKVVGVLGLAFVQSEKKFGKHELALLSRFAELASIALENANLLATYKNELMERIQAEEALEMSQANYQAVFNAANDGIFVQDIDTGKILDANEKFGEICGRSCKEIITGGLAGFGTGKFPYSEQEAIAWLYKAAKEGPQLFEWRIQHGMGEDIWTEVNLKRTKLGNQQCILAVVRDISDRKKKEAEFHRIYRKNEALINAIPDFMLLIRRDGTFMDYKAQKDILYLLPEHFLGKTVGDVMPKALAQQIMAHIENAFATGKLQMFEYQLPVNRILQYYEARIVPSGNDEVFSIIRNITDKKRMEEQLEFISLHDSLTGLYNRGYFEEEMKRLGEVRDGVAGLILCDLDGLKLINDTLGHSMGDEVLKVIAHILKAAFRPEDMVARIGGDEFAVLLPSNSIPLFEAACQRIWQLIKEYNSKQPIVPISLSMGFAVSKENAIDSNALFKEADRKMYREKLHRQQSKKSAVVKALMKALEVRDFITEGHGERLQGLVAALAAAIGLPEHQIADLRLLARFHDIGKVGIPDSILFKPAPLTVDEFAVMQGHCEIGYRIAKTAPELEPIAEGILKHQEWWNGEGYPLGIKGGEIPIECRILAIADAYDAMTNDRPYRKALTMEEAIAELRQCAGKQFDPDLIEPFIRILTEVA
ncbi:MAG: HD domain-containing phosphohydrolase [Veillonellales bacterium]